MLGGRQEGRGRGRGKVHANRQAMIHDARDRSGDEEGEEGEGGGKRKRDQDEDGRDNQVGSPGMCLFFHQRSNDATQIHAHLVGCVSNGCNCSNCPAPLHALSLRFPRSWKRRLSSCKGAEQLKRLQPTI